MTLILLQCGSKKNKKKSQRRDGEITMRSSLLGMPMNLSSQFSHISLKHTQKSSDDDDNLQVLFHLLHCKIRKELQMFHIAGGIIS